jgi:hypothetical protein
MKALILALVKWLIGLWEANQKKLGAFKLTYERKKQDRLRRATLLSSVDRLGVSEEASKSKPD